MILYRQKTLTNPYTYTHKTVRGKNKFKKAAGTGAICKNHCYFYTIGMRNQKMKLRKQFHL